MSRCRCCDKKLNSFELTRKNDETGEYIDMCNGCFSSSGLSTMIEYTERSDLQYAEDINEEEDSVSSWNGYE